MHRTPDTLTGALEALPVCLPLPCPPCAFLLCTLASNMCSVTDWIPSNACLHACLFSEAFVQRCLFGQPQINSGYTPAPAAMAPPSPGLFTSRAPQIARLTAPLIAQAG